MSLRDSDTPFSSALLNDAKATVRAFVSSSTFDAAATTAFGVSSAAVATAIRELDRKDWPKLVMLDEEDLHGARAAYEQRHDTIYLSREFVAHSTSAAVTGVLIEEIGHAIDARVNQGDAAGDEGAIFSAYVLAHPPGAPELAALKAENDHGTISVHGKIASVELAAPVVGSVTLDGSLADWTAADQIDESLSVSSYDIYAKATGGSYVFALKAPAAIGADTTAWLNTDQNAATGYKIWGFAGGAEYNINFDANGTPRLYTGDAGQTLVPSANVTFAYSADHTVVEFALPASAIGSSAAIDTLWDINDTTFLPTDFSFTQYQVLPENQAPTFAVGDGKVTTMVGSPWSLANGLALRNRLREPGPATGRQWSAAERHARARQSASRLGFCRTPDRVQGKLACDKILAQSILAPVSLTAFLHFTISDRMKAASSSGVDDSGIVPSLSN